MLVSNDYLKYDMTLEEYYITVDAVTNYTDIDSDDLQDIFDSVAKSLKVISHSVYRLIDTVYRGPEPYRHQQFMRLKIYDNTQGEVRALMFAMLEAVKGAVQSGMDLNAYINEPKETFPYTVKEELYRGMLLDKGEKLGYDLTIAYTDEETEEWS